ncbi:MAG: Ig-like domain-containing protein, partial [Deltaproteobacteria bacterium]
MTLRSRPKIADMFRCFCILLTLFFGMAAIIGSGGGGGGGGSDTTAPEIVSTSPADSATGVAIASTVSVTFSEDMDASTITAASFSIDNGVTGSVNYSSSTRMATFTPSVDLSANTTYTATISASCTDAAGNGLSANYSWTFTTGGAAVAVWSSVGGPVSPAGNEDESEDPTMMIVNGQPAVGYRQASFQANLNTWDGASWGTSVTDPTGDNMNYTSYRAPAYCSNGTGAYLAYSLAGVSGGTDEEFYDRVFVRTWTGGSTWSAPL